MTIGLRSWYPVATTPGHFNPAHTGDHFGAPDTTLRYCASCGCKLRAKNRSRVCDPCDDSARAAHYKRQVWLAERGLLP